KELSEAVKPVEMDEIFEILDNKTRLGRVNLRSWKAQGGEDVELLWKLMLRATQHTPKTTDLFLTRWEEFAGWIEQRVITYPSSAERSMKRWLELISEIAHSTKVSSELPLVSHSSMYRNFYQPTYRIIYEKDLYLEK
ncbi:MAG: hypothetical protein ACTSQF_05715, partial [Candidatus Heimdallarchaeaceae archaeon]